MARWIAKAVCLFGILALLTVCTGSVGWAQTLAKMGVMTVGGGVPAAEGCASDTLTIGDNDSSGATGVNLDYVYIRFSGYVAAASCTIDSVVIILSDSNTDYMRAAIYADNGSGSPTGAPLGQSAQTGPGNNTAENITMTISPAVSLTEGTRYWIAFWNSNVVGAYHNGDVASGTRYLELEYHATNDFPTNPTTTDWNKQLVIYGLSQ